MKKSAHLLTIVFSEKCSEAVFNSVLFFKNLLFYIKKGFLYANVHSSKNEVSYDEVLRNHVWNDIFINTNVI